MGTVTLSRRGKRYPKPCKAHRGPPVVARPKELGAVPELTRLEEAVAEEFLPLMRQRLADEVAALEAAFSLRRHCCEECGAEMRPNGVKRKGCLTRFGMVPVPSHVVRCPKCQTSKRPFLLHLGLETTGRLSPSLARLVALMATVVPYQLAVVLLRQFLGVTVSAMTVWRNAQRLGEAQDQQVLKQAEYDRQPGRTDERSQDAPAVVVAGTDGCALGMQVRSKRRRRKDAEELPALPALEDGHFREVKSGVLLLPSERVETSPGRQSVVRRALVTCLGNADLVFDLMWSKLQQMQWLGPQTVVVVIGDGAEWIWNRAMMFPNRCEILDFWHAVEKGWEWARIRFGAESAAAKKMMKGITANLRAGKVDEVIKQLLGIEARTPEEAEKLAALVRYYKANKGRMKYAEYRRLNYGIGSGAIESAHKQLVQARFRQAGMRWSENGARRLLALRVTLLNGEWERLQRLPLARVAA